MMECDMQGSRPVKKGERKQIWMEDEVYDARPVKSSQSTGRLGTYITPKNCLSEAEKDRSLYSCSDWLFNVGGPWFSAAESDPNDINS